MSHLLAPTHTYADSIPLGRRITEIMAEKGPAYTIAAMAKRLEINRETLRLMLKGEREIYTFELERIAQDLKVPVERILQSDIAEAREQLKEMIIRNDVTEQSRALEMAEHLASVSIGLTERCIGENELSCVYHNLDQIKHAYQILLNILPDAELILEKYRDPEIYLWVLINMMQKKISCKEYDNLMELVSKAEPYLSSNPRMGGTIHYTLATMNEEEGNLAAARENYDRMIDFYRMVKETVTTARALNAVVIFEYQQKNYTKAYDLIVEAWDIAQLHQDLRLSFITGREYGRIMIRLNESEQAVKVLTYTLRLLEERTDPEYAIMESQLLLLLAIVTNQPCYAETIFNKQIGTRSIRKLALKFLMDYYEMIGCPDEKKRYEQSLQNLPGSPIDMLLRFSQADSLALLTLFDYCQLHGWNKSW